MNLSHQLVGALRLPIELAGIVGTMSYQDTLNDDEVDAVETIKDGIKQWGSEAPIFSRTIPRKKILANIAGSDVGYLRDKTIRAIFDELGQQLATRMGL